MLQLLCFRPTVYAYYVVGYIAVDEAKMICNSMFYNQAILYKN